MPRMSQALLKRTLGPESFWVCLEAKSPLWLSKSTNFEKELVLFFFFFFFLVVYMSGVNQRICMLVS